MKFKIGDEVMIAKSTFDNNLNLLIGKKGIVSHCWDCENPPKECGREQPEYDVIIDDKHYFVLEEELK